jgi:hypothetical protein
MKRLLFLMIGLLFCFSCSEDEKPAGNFIDGTKWKCDHSVSYYTDNNELMYTTQEIILLSFTNSTFTYAYTADLTYHNGASSSPIPKEPYTVNGTYTFEYPVTTLLSDDSRIPKKIKIGPNQIETVSDSGGESLVFVKVRE